MALPFVQVKLLKVKFWNNIRVAVLLTLISPIKINGFNDEKFKLEKIVFVKMILLLFPEIKLEVVVFLKIELKNAIYQNEIHKHSIWKV